MASLFILTIWLLALTSAQDPNDDGINCKRCACTTSDDAQILTINCTNRTLHHVGGGWPKHNSTIIASVSGNDIPTLEALPASNATIEINFSWCKIQYLRPSLFADAPNVKFLDLSHNLLGAEEVSSEKFRGPYNNSMYEPTAVEHLNLAYNQIHSLGQHVFEHMPDLKILNLEGNDFKVLDANTQLALSSIRRLQSLNLANNELTEMIDDAIDSHENLTELNLSRNRLDFVPSSLRRIGKSLEILTLDDNPIIEFVSETFLGLSNITELSANNLTKLKYINANTFASMPKLKKLSLCHNFVLTDIDREAFGVNQTIEEFYLNNNVLYRIDYKLLPWSKLRVFQFKENPLDCSCDLYNITQALSRDITRLEDGPYCTDPRTSRTTQVFYLKSDICSHEAQTSSNRKGYIEYHFSLVRIILIVLSVFVAIASILALILGVVRYRKYRRGVSYPYASQISYNPVSTTTSKY